jgi:glycosyltransferase involved in cell wall biosynthesis
LQIITKLGGVRPASERSLQTLHRIRQEQRGVDCANYVCEEAKEEMGKVISIWQEKSPKERPTVSVVIPALNEARNLPHVAARMPWDIDEIIFVDGNSVDDTADVAKQLWPKAVHLKQTRKGKGNALACGFAAASGDIVVMLDADGSTDPAEIPRYVGALVSGADFAKGSRFLQGGGSEDITLFRRLGNKALNWLVNVLFGTQYSDLCYGYNAFWRRCLDVMRLPDIDAAEPKWGDGFEIETLINVRVAANGLKIVEVCSFEAGRIHGVSNLNAVSDGLRVLRTIGQERADSRASRRRGPRATNAVDVTMRHVDDLRLHGIAAGDAEVIA